MHYPFESMAREAPLLKRFGSLADFLTASYLYKKSINPRFSYSVWARQIQLKSSSMLLMLAQGKRLPSRDLTQKLLRYFQFSAEDEIYFRNLVLMSRFQKQVKEGRIQSPELIPDLKEAFRVLEDDKFQLLSSWWAYVLRESVQLSFFKEDKSFLKNFLYAIPEKEFSKTLALLLKLELLERNRGKLKNTGQSIHTFQDKNSKALRHYHKQVLELAKKSLDQSTPLEREVSGGVFPIRSDRLPEAKKIIRDFQMKLFRLLEDPRGDSLFQLEVAFFPLVKNRSQKE